MHKCFSLRRVLAAAALWALAGLLLTTPCSRAQDPPAKVHRRENRFLFVIDTSSAMKARTNGVEEAVIGLLASGMNGQLRKGDTIGLWTYSDRLDADFPMQVWSEKHKEDLLSEVRDHLRALHYEKRSHLEKVLPEITNIVAHSERVTVILIFDGSEPIKGTPFDKDINELHKHYAREFKTARAPFVTLLAARNGAVFDYTINYPATVVVPPTADPLPPPETSAPPSVAASPPPVVIPHPPAEPKPPKRVIEITLSGSNFARNAAVPPPAISNIAAVGSSMPLVTNTPAPVAAVPAAPQIANTNFASPKPAPSPPAPQVTAKVPPAAVVSYALPAVPAAPPSSVGQPVALFIAAFSLLTIAVVLVLFLLRRSRGGPQASLISQTIDRPR